MDSDEKEIIQLIVSFLVKQADYAFSMGKTFFFVSWNPPNLKQNGSNIRPDILEEAKKVFEIILKQNGFNILSSGYGKNGQYAYSLQHQEKMK